MPNHVNAVRTRQGKYAVYSNWADGTNTVESADQETELYDYTNWRGVVELDNIAAQPGALNTQLSGLLNDQIIPNELNEPVPAYLKAAQEEGVRRLLQPVEQAGEHGLVGVGGPVGPAGSG